MLFLSRVVLISVFSFFARPVLAGVISDAPSFASVLMKILTFLLSLVGIVAILAIVISGLMYMLAAGDVSQIARAKKQTLMSVIGMSLALAALILVRQISRLL